jgi:hypothetical protein
MTRPEVRETNSAERQSRSAQVLGDLSSELTGWLPVLQRLADAEALRNMALGRSSEITSTAVRSIISARRLRDKYFWPAMTEPAWTILLELYANQLVGQRPTVAAVTAAAELPLVSALHWIDWLAGRGIVSSHIGAEDEQTATVQLTAKGIEQMHRYLIAALKLSPWVQ